MGCNIGIYNLHMRGMGGGEKLTLGLAERLSLDHNVTIFCGEQLDLQALEQFFAVDLSRVKAISLENHGPLAKLASKVPGIRGQATVSDHYRQLKKLNLDIFINNSYGSNLVNPAAHGVFMCMFPHSNARPVTINSYSTIVAISAYSAEWVRRMWNRSAEIIYPPCDDMGPAERKEKIVLHVGRFVADVHEDERHHKAQRLLIDAFSNMSDLQREGWQLHLAGSAARDKQTSAFLESLVYNARGLPVSFHFNATREEIRSVYRRAAIYWHATGYGSDVTRHPSKQEHFGITTVEAMSAGAVPVVYPSGGQKEIVSDGSDGLWWNTIDELVRQTRRLTSDRDLCASLSAAAIASSKRFSREVFASSVDRLTTH